MLLKLCTFILILECQGTMLIKKKIRKLFLSIYFFNVPAVSHVHIPINLNMCLFSFLIKNLKN